MKHVSALFLFFVLGCVGPCNSTDTRGDYLAEQMIEYGCVSSSPCNFLAAGGPGVYTCTGSYPDSSTLADEFGSPNKFLENGDPTRPGYIIYDDGTGEPDADANYNDLLPPKAHPEMLALQKRGEELGCRRVNPVVFEPSAWSREPWMSGERQYSCIVSTCEAWAEKGVITIRRKTDLPDGA
jgi:hypothetical protein